MEQKPNIVILCEYHWDGYQSEAQRAILARITENKKFTYSLVEGRYFLDDNEPVNCHNSIFEDSFIKKQSPVDACWMPESAICVKEQFNNSFISYDFNVNYMEQIPRSRGCSYLDKLHRSQIYSEFFGNIISLQDEYSEEDRQRDVDIIKNLEDLTTQLGENYTIGWAGEAHCVDFYYYLKENRSALLKNIVFINFSSPCWSDMEKAIPEFAIFTTLMIMNGFQECAEDERVYEIMQRFYSICQDVGFDSCKADPYNIQGKLEEEFLNSEYTLNLNLSLFGEPGTFYLSEIADLPIFN